MRVLPREDHRDNVLGADYPRARGVDTIPEQLPPPVPGPLVHRQPGVVAGVGVLQVKLIKRDLYLGAGGHGDGPGVGEGLRADQQQGVQGTLYQPLAAGQSRPVQQRVVGGEPGPGPSSRLGRRVKLDPESVGGGQVGGGRSTTIPEHILLFNSILYKLWNCCAFQQKFAQWLEGAIENLNLYSSA